MQFCNFYPRFCQYYYSLFYNLDRSHYFWCVIHICLREFIPSFIVRNIIYSHVFFVGAIIILLTPSITSLLSLVCHPSKAYFYFKITLVPIIMTVSGFRIHYHIHVFFPVLIILGIQGNYYDHTFLGIKVVLINILVLDLLLRCIYKAIFDSLEDDFPWDFFIKITNKRH